MSGVTGLEDCCEVCSRVSGDHTLREWAACLGTATVDLPYEPVPDDAARVANEALRGTFGMPDDWLIADNVVAKALVLDASSGQVGVKIPVLLHEFNISGPSGLAAVATVAFLGPGETMRKYGRLIRDNANGAANASERA